MKRIMNSLSYWFRRMQKSLKIEFHDISAIACNQMQTFFCVAKFGAFFDEDIDGALT